MKSRTSLQSVLMVMVLLAGSLVWAVPKPVRSPQSVPPFPGTLLNARFVYVTSYDGDQFNPNLLPEDRQAIATVEDAIEKWGRFTLVYEADQADMVLMVMSRPSEDVLALYDAHGWPQSQYRWRMMGRSGLQPGESPLIINLEKAFNLATAK